MYQQQNSSSKVSIRECAVRDIIHLFIGAHVWQKGIVEHPSTVESYVCEKEENHHPNPLRTSIQEIKTD